MQYGDFYKIIEFHDDVIKQIDNAISNMDLQFKKSLINNNSLKGRDANLRI